MKCLSVRAPWWLFLVRGWKPVENRSRVDGREPAIVRHRGPLLIHASTWYDAEEIANTVSDVRHLLPADFGPVTLRMFEEARGQIVGIVNAVGTVGPSSCTPTSGAAPPGARIIDWHIPGSFGLVVADAAEVPHVAMPGRLGLFDVQYLSDSPLGRAVAEWATRCARCAPPEWVTPSAP